MDIYAMEVNLKELLSKVGKFNSTEFEKNKNLYKELSQKQNPHTLFITCSDSRVVPNLITNSLPGDLFVIRNIANIVPSYEQSSEYLSTTSSIEYAVKVLKVKNIVICGHTNCGGCKALYYDNEKLKNIPITEKWLELAITTKERIENLKIEHNYNITERLVEQENIILQINHLLSYPYVKEKHHNNTLNIYGWYYDIENGNVYNYNKLEKVFEIIN